MGVTALLNAASPLIEYPYSTTQVIAAVQAALHGTSYPISMLDLTHPWDVNESCPLN